MTSSMERLNRLSLSIRGTRHPCRSWMAQQSTPGEVPDCMAHYWRVWAKATISWYFIMQMSFGSWIPVGNRGRKSPHLKPAMFGGAFHFLYFSFWTSGKWKTTTCLLASSCILALLRGLVLLCWREWNFCHQLGRSFLSLQVCPVPGLLVIGVRSWWVSWSSPVLGSPSIPALVPMGVWSHRWRGGCT